MTSTTQTSMESSLFTTPINTTKSLLELIDKFPDPTDVPAELHAHPSVFCAFKRAALRHMMEISRGKSFCSGLRGNMVLYEDPEVDPGVCEVWTVAQVNERKELGLTPQEYRDLKVSTQSV